MRHLTCSASPSSFVQFSWESLFGELSCTGYKQIHMAFSGTIQETIERHEDGQGWGEWNLENTLKSHDNMAGGFLFYLYFNCIYVF